MSGSHYNEGGKRHAGVRVRTTHTGGPDFVVPDVPGVPFSQARDGEQQQRADIAPHAVDGAIHIKDGTIDIASFASTLRPPRVEDALPGLPDADYPEGSLVFLTTDGKLYRNVAGAWTVGVDGADILANSITAGQIKAGAIGTTELAAGAVIANVANVGGTVTIDDNGIAITDGALTIEDYAGRSAMSASGFEGSWRSFIASGGVLNALVESAVASGTTLATSEVSGADSVADYEASLSGELPYWVVDTTHATDLPLKAWSGPYAPGGWVVGVSEGASPAGWASIYQDVPIYGSDKAVTINMWLTTVQGAIPQLYSLGFVTLTAASFVRLEFAFTYDAGLGYVVLEVYAAHRQADHSEWPSGTRALVDTVVVPGSPSSLYLAGVELTTQQHFGEIRGPGSDIDRGKLWLRNFEPEFYMYGGMYVSKDLTVDEGVNVPSGPLVRFVPLPSPEQLLAPSSAAAVGQTAITVPHTGNIPEEAVGLQIQVSCKATTPHANGNSIAVHAGAAGAVMGRCYNGASGGYENTIVVGYVPIDQGSPDQISYSLTRSAGTVSGGIVATGYWIPI